jgi:uncharacterized protein
MLDGLLEPAVLFFALGLLAGIFKSDLRIPEALYDTLSIFLLISIGLKGGLQLTKTNLTEIIAPVAAALFLGLLIPVIAFTILNKLGKLNRYDSAALAAHYGSVSAVTFAVVQSFLERSGIAYEGYTTLLLALMEIPAIGVGVLLARTGGAEKGGSFGKLLHEIFLGKSILLLLGGLVIGFLAGPVRAKPVEMVFIEPFKGMLAFFLLEMGLVTSRRLGDLRKIGLFLIAFGVGMPLFSAVLGVFAGVLAGLSVGGTTVLATLAASASYIAAPAAVRIAIPEANPTYYLTASLGITFPFNIVFGVPLYFWLAQFVHSIF